jgi:hypothetical protein
MGGSIPLAPARIRSSATPSWVRPGTDTCKYHTSVGRTRGKLLLVIKRRLLN